jgi:hypothetical protein
VSDGDSVLEAIRRAMVAQGKVDPDEVFAKAAEIDLDAPTEPEQTRLRVVEDPIPEIPEPEQISLATEAHARSTDPGTSHAAARSLSADTLRKTQQAVYACFSEFGSMHHEALLDNYGEHRESREWPPQSISGLRTRTAELVDAGLLVDTGRTIRLDSGRLSIVWGKP